jgi:hypothetical protein
MQWRKSLLADKELALFDLSALLTEQKEPVLDG